MFAASIGSSSLREAEDLRLLTESALRGLGPWPEEIEAAPGVLRWISHAGGAEAAGGDGDQLDVYASSLTAEVAASTARTQLHYLARLIEVSGSLDEATRTDVELSLTRAAGRPTRNRMLQAIRCYYRWRGGDDPTTGIRRITERPSGEPITYLTKEQRDLLLVAAEGHRSELAVWIACLAGLRRGEIARAQWSDIDWTSGRLAIRQGKVGGRRAVPLHARLAEVLWGVRRKRGRIVDWPASYYGYETVSGRSISYFREVLNGDVPGELIGWNIFRHTFASQAVQAGISLDKVARWLGHTPGVCRRYYGEFVPRDHRDEEIDRL